MSKVGIITVQLSQVKSLPDKDRRALRNYVIGGSKTEARYRDEPEVRKILFGFPEVQPQQETFDIRDGKNRYRPCPNCKSEFGMGLVTQNDMLAVQCMACDFRGPEVPRSLGTESDSAAFDAWNATTDAEMAALTSDELMRVVTTEFVRLHESGCAGMRLEIEPMTAFAVVAALQLALRHPAIAADTVAPRLQEVIECVRIKFEMYAPAITEAIRRGNDPERDIDRRQVEMWRAELERETRAGK